MLCCITITHSSDNDRKSVGKRRRNGRKRSSVNAVIPMSAEGITLSGTWSQGETADGSYLWRHPQMRRPKVQMRERAGISQAKGQRRKDRKKCLRSFFLSSVSGARIRCPAGKACRIGARFCIARN